MRTYKVKVKYTFEGTVEVRAENRTEAKSIVKQDFGAVIGDISTSNESNSKNEAGVIDWDFDIHPSKETIK